jgi:uncharacterized membrane protein YbhN (UPF0104 family)
MHAWVRKWWSVLKVLLTVAILVGIGWRFARDLQSPDLWRRSFHPGWLVVSGLLYLGGLGFSALFWHRLLRALGQQPSVSVTLRAYYIGQMGKYLPGKAWALLLRATLSRGPGVRVGVAALTSFYEVLTTMTSGVLLAAILFAVLLPDTPSTTRWPILRSLLQREAAENVQPDRTSLVMSSLLLVALVGIPLLPGVFNRLVHRLALPFRDKESLALPHVRLSMLLEGLLLTAGDWLLLGASLWTAVWAVLGQPQPGGWDAWGRDTAIMALAYVAGFVIIVVPSGLGIREFFLTIFLVPELAPLLGSQEARAVAVLTVLVLRLVWTVAELVSVAAVYWLPGPALEMAAVTAEANKETTL